MGFSRKLALKKLLRDETVKAIEPFVYRINNIVREGYKFLKLFFISKLEKDEAVPVIDRKFLNNIFQLVSTRKYKIRDNKLKEFIELKPFYDSVFSKLQSERTKVDGNNLGFLLGEEIVQILTCIKNNCTFNYFNYITLLSRCCLHLYGKQDKKLVYKIAKSLYKDEIHKDCHEFTEFINQWRPIVQEGLNKKGQERIPYMYKILHFVENQNCNLKLLNLFPLRTSLIPCSICITHSVCKRDMYDESIWSSIKNQVAKKFKQESREDNKEKLCSLRTDGVYASLYFGQPSELRYTKGVKKPKKQKTDEMYIEDFDWDDESRTTVQIDPNKGNLLYCLDATGNNLSYKQTVRRKMQQKTRYKQIRKNLEQQYGQELKDLTERIKLTNKKSVDSTKFINYLTLKQEQEEKFLELYQLQSYRKLRFNSWINSRRSEDLFLNKFRKTYGSEDGVIVTIGDWEQKRNISFGKEPTKGKSLRDLFRRHGYTVLLVDERLTSKRCWKCEGDNEYKFQTRQDPRPWMKGKTQKVWGLSRCTKCEVVHNRDMNAVKNLGKIVNAIRHGLERPRYLTRKNQCNANPT